MEQNPSLREIPVQDRDWWSTLDEGYWQALVEQGELNPQTVPPSPPQETFHFLGLEAGIQDSSAIETKDKGSSAAQKDEWQAAQEALDQGDIFQLHVSGANRGGLLVEWNGLQGFVPASHLLDMPRFHHTKDRISKLADRIGDSLTVRIIEVDVEQERLVFSERAGASGSGSPVSLLKTLRPGDVRRGRITNLTTFGAFVDFGGVEGLIHISEISWDRVRHPSDVLTPGQEVEVYIVGVNPEERRIALSLKRLRPDPWANVEARYRVGEIIQGQITNVVSFGAFVRVEEGLEGLIHISELAEGNFLHPRSVVHEGDTVQVRILNIDRGDHRLGLSLRQAYEPGLASPDGSTGHESPA